jgi:hypothetical protein
MVEQVIAVEYSRRTTLLVMRDIIAARESSLQMV